MSSFSARLLEKSSSGFSKIAIRLPSLSTLSFPSPNFEGSLNYNVQGKTLQIVGVNYVPDIFTEPFNSLNLNFNYKFGRTGNLKLGLGIKNLLDEKVESYYYTNDIKSIYSSLSPRREFKLSLGINF